MVDASTAAGAMLKLYELRTEPTLRRARAWFAFEFHPSSARDVLSTWLGPGHESAPYRMVTTYWEMAASFVTHGAIDAEMFHDANSEYVAVIAKLGPFLPELRRLSGSPRYLRHLEAVVLAMPDAEQRLSVMRKYMRRKKAETEAVTT